MCYRQMISVENVLMICGGSDIIVSGREWAIIILITEWTGQYGCIIGSLHSVKLRDSRYQMSVYERWLAHLSSWKILN